LKIAVVILNWNGKKLLEEFLPSIIRFSPNVQIYVADNASTDDSVAFIKNSFPLVKIISNIGNFGYAKGYNKALQYVEEEIYALVNSDIEVTENWLDAIEKTFLAEPDTAIVQPRILDYKNRNYFEYAGAAGGFIDAFGYPFCRGRLFATLEKDKGQYNDDTEIFWASGACFFIRKSAFRELNGFDADFFAHQEEIDLCWRAFNKGFKTRYIADSVVYHVGGATLQQGHPQKTFLNFRNSLLMLTKNLPKQKLYPVLLMRLVLDGLAGIQFLASGKITHCFAIARAHFVFYSLFFSFLKKRGYVQKPLYYKTSSIVYKYYIRGIKVFSELF
jgi:GT2 family glycosyltransferase